MIWPEQRLVRLVLIPSLLTLAMLPAPRLWPAIAFLDGVFIAVFLTDLVSLVRLRHWRAERVMPATLSIGKVQNVTIQLRNLNRHDASVTLVDFWPIEFEVDPGMMEGEIAAGRGLTWQYQLKPTRRGGFHVERIQLFVKSRMGFWRLEKLLPCDTRVRVYPDIRQISQYTMLARRDRLSALGVRKARRVGSDNEFERLRDYVPGDDPRHLDWRATARRRQLTVRDYQANQSQRLIFLIDSGRMMAGDAGDGLSPLDHAFNSMIMLAHVALLKGDQVGLMVFSDRVRVFLKPEGGPGQIGKIIHAIHDIFPEMVESRFELAFSELKSRCRKRGLVVFITNLFDEFHSQWALQSLQRIVGQHLPLAVFFRQPELIRLADKGVEILSGNATEMSDEDFAAAGATADLLNHRHDTLEKLRHMGAFVIDTEPRELTAPLVNQYLELKAKQLI